MNTVTLLGIVIIGLQAAQAILTIVFKNSLSHQFNLKLEEFKQDYQREQESRERKDKFRLAAIDERLRAHQKAYSLWSEMIRTIHSNEPEKAPINAKCNDFWNNNCLYLTNESRRMFNEAQIAYADYHMYKYGYQQARGEGNKPEIDGARKDMMEAFSKVSEMGDSLLKSVDLETMASEPITSNGKIITAEGVEDK